MCMCVSVGGYVHVCVGHCRGQKRVPGSLELPDVDVGNSTWVPLEEQQVLLIMEPSLQRGALFL